MKAHDAIIGLEGALNDLDDARQALSGLLECHAAHMDCSAMLFCILNTLNRAHNDGQAAVEVIYESRKTPKVAPGDVQQHTGRAES